MSNPIPGNHGMTSTLRIPMIVSGGLATQQRFAPEAPLSGAVRHDTTPATAGSGTTAGL